MNRSIPTWSLGLALCAGLAAGRAGAQHDEQPGDAPGRATATPTASRGVVRRGPFASVQVNVDRNGNNIRGDAANEPSIAVSPADPRRIVIGWRQFDSVSSNFRENGVAYSADGGGTWTFPGPIQNGLFNSDPVLDTDVAGNFYYLSYPGGRTCKVFKSSNAGVSWTGPVTTSGGDKPWMIVDKTSSSGRGFVYVIWQVLHGPSTFIRSTNGGASFSGPTAVPSAPTFGTMAVAPNGDLYACGLVRQNFGSFVVARSNNAKDRNQTPAWTTSFPNMGGRMGFRGTPNPAGLMGQAQVAVDPSSPSNVYVLCSIDPPVSDPMDVHVVRSANGGRTWSAPVRVNNDSTTNGAWQWLGTLSVAPNGRLDAAWADTRAGTSSQSEVFYSYSIDQGRTWSKNVVISPQFDSTVGWPNQNKIGDYYHMVSDDAKAHLAYAATFNNEQDVWYVKLGDCNENAVHDSTDIANGTSFDANANTVPDECETCQKDLGNGNRGGLALRVCGDDLTAAGSRATLQAEGPASSPVILALSLRALNPPIALPFGGALVPDLFNAPSVVAAGFVTNARGRLGLTVTGGASGVASTFVQAFSIRGTGVAVSNAVEMRAGR